MKYAKRQSRGRMSFGTGIFLVLFALVFIGGAWMLSDSHKKRGKGKEKAQEEEESGLATKRLELQAKVEDCMGWDLEDLDAGRVAELEAIVERASTFISAGGGVSMEGYGHVVDLLSLWMKAESERVERQGHAALEGGDLDRAVTLLGEAREMQLRANGRFPDGAGADIRRVVLLEGELEKVRVEPMFKEIAALEKDGKAALGKGDWEGALAKFEQALGKQGTLHLDFPDSPRVNAGRLAELNALVEKAKSWQDLQHVRGMAFQAWDLAHKGRHLEAARMYKQALGGLQGFGAKGRSGEAEKLRSDIRSGMDNSASLHFDTVFSRGWEAVGKSLSSGKVPAALAAVEGMRAVYDELAREFTGLVEKYEGTRERLEFMEKRKARVGLMAEELRKELVAVPGKPGWWMLRYEVWQDLYSALVDVENPSREKGGDYPVESVTVVEAGEFAKRAGWLLGDKVVLPSGDLFFAAAGTPGAPRDIALGPSGVLWKVRTGDPNKAGFYNLWGNVGEWLEPEGEKAFHAGGNYLDSPESVFKEPVREVTVRDRNRLVGFRIALFRGE
jgi:tetratricopeptide (TPR) repeat protein